MNISNGKPPKPSLRKPGRKSRQLVLADLQRITSYVKEHEQEFIETANECSAKAVQKTLTQQRKELDKAQNRISELNILFRKLYEDNALGKLSDEHSRHKRSDTSLSRFCSDFE